MVQIFKKMPPHIETSSSRNQNDEDVQIWKMTVGCPHCQNDVRVSLTVHHPDDKISEKAKHVDKEPPLPKETVKKRLEPDPGVKKTVEKEVPSPQPPSEDEQEEFEPSSDVEPTSDLFEVSSEVLEESIKADVEQFVPAPTEIPESIRVKTEVNEDEEDDDDLAIIKEEPGVPMNDHIAFQNSGLGQSNFSANPEVSGGALLRRAEQMSFQRRQMSKFPGNRFGQKNISMLGKRPMSRGFQHHVQKRRMAAPPAPKPIETPFDSLQLPMPDSDQLEQWSTDPMNLPGTSSDQSDLDIQAGMVETMGVDRSDLSGNLSQEIPQDIPQDIEPLSFLPLKSKKTVHQCGVCGKAFGSRRDLTRHELIHSGIKPYQCEICLKAFTLKGNMEKHVISKHTPLQFPKVDDTAANLLEKQQYALEQEGQKWVMSRINLKNGKKVNVFRCLECDYQSLKRHNMSRHYGRHSRQAAIHQSFLVEQALDNAPPEEYESVTSAGSESNNK